MVQITDITNQKNKEKLNLFIDGEFYCGILKETAISNNFFVGKNIEKQTLDNIILQSEAKQAFAKATDYLGLRMHTKGELKTKLLKKGFGKQAIDIAITRLQEYKYLDDVAYSKSAVRQAKMGKKLIEAKLASKGVSKQDIATATMGISDNDQTELATELANKYLKNKNFADCKAKLYAYLARKGFEYNIINLVLSKFGEDIQEESI